MKRKHARSSRSGLIRTLLCLLAVSAGIFLWTLWGALSVQREYRRMAEAYHGETLARETAPESAPTEAAQPVTTAGTTVETTVETTAPAEREILERFRPLYEENPEILGWLTIPDTRIDYPVMYTPEDPEKYLYRDFQGEQSAAGCLFVDAHCGPDSQNRIIYGHNMLNGSMFRGLLRYEQENYWREHPTFTFDTLYETGEYEVMAAFYDRVYYKTEDVFKFYQFIDPEDEAAFNEGMENYRQKALYDTGVAAGYGDRLLTLVTCAYHTDNGRFVVVARKTE